MTSIQQTPKTDDELIRCSGDLITFSLSTSKPKKGNAFLRTNLAHSKIHRREIIDCVEFDKPRLDADWYDIKMVKLSETNFSITLPLIEIGTFSAKTFFKEQNNEKILWPDGENVKIKVEPAHTIAANSIYTAFIRQFKNSNRIDKKNSSHSSGTFRNFINQLDLIINIMGFKNIQLLPIHPVPTSFAKMGEYGSPFAVLDLKNVNPAYAEFDKSATPMQQFEELVDAIHLRNAKIFLDIPINHTGWASWLQIHHPEWYIHNPDGTFKSPGAWGVVWEDLSELDYKHKKLWEHMADVFLFWCRRGVDGFRCDAGYMIPSPVWEYIVAKVREEFPNTIFMLEGLGGKISVTERLLTKADLNWAYSELFQNYDRSQIENYLPSCITRSEKKGLQIHFAETHDNCRLAAKSKQYAKLRTAIAALFSQNGGFGITAGVEWFATEKIDVHQLNSLNWDAEENQIDFIKKLNNILINQPAFFDGAKLKMIQQGEHNGIVLLRQTENDNETILIVANLDDQNESFISWLTEQYPKTDFFDLISEREIIAENLGALSGFYAKPGEIFCLAISNSKYNTSIIENQRFKEKALSIINYQAGNTFDLSFTELQKKPENFISKITNLPVSLCVTKWNYPQDLKRKVVVPTSHFLLLQSEFPFNVKVFDEEKVLKSESSLLAEKNFVLLTPDTFSENKEHLLKFTFYKQEKAEHVESKILVLSHNKNITLKSRYSKKDVLHKNAYALLTNGRGAMAQVRGEWAVLKSKYDSFLAANLHPDCPVDRHVLFTRCRAWIVCSDYSCEINIDNLVYFEKISNNSAKWRFTLPVGQGKTVDLDIILEMLEGKNISIVKFCRLQSTKNVDCKLNSKTPVKIIVRPDIENRCFHHVTKAYTGLEKEFPESVKSEEKGFSFSPPKKPAFKMTASKGKFVVEPEWKYMVHLEEETERNLEDHTDLFSPGYFSFGLNDRENVKISAGTIETMTARNTHVISLETIENHQIINSIKQFIVKRDDSLTVIAGYPWFLDWGRDTLIALRGIISAGFVSEAKDILKQFAKFEKNGTLPNMIRGDDQSDRDTSDAPLWFFVACSDYIKTTGENNFVDEICGKRTIREVLESIIENYITGTPNGIKMDEKSGLIFSPSHFTWMDTNHPAGSPREGYPIEIQSLWYFALEFYFKISEEKKYKKLSEKVEISISELFTQSQNNCLSDCLHANSNTPAQLADPDDAIRSNQLFAVTLGAVKDKKLCEKIISASEQLLIPGAIRSLADVPVSHPLPVFRNGELLNDPVNPYFGNYTGDEDTQRKAAYHNGTAWTWPFPSFAEALLITYGDKASDTAKSILLSSQEIIEKGCILQIPEILDGNFPHALKGCGAQAWGITELYRLLKSTYLI